MGFNAKKRLSAPARSAASKRSKRRHDEEDEGEDDDFRLPSGESDSDDANFCTYGDDSDGLDDIDDIDTDDDGSDDEIEPEVVPAAAASSSEEINRVLTPLGLSAFGTDVSFLDILLGISAISQEHQTALSMFKEECLADMSTGQLSQSLEPTEAFLDREDGWASHDRDIDRLWDDFVVDIVRLGDGVIKREDLVKPSGPLRAVLTFFWHYPTWNTRKRAFGHTLDKTNQSLQFQVRKMGQNSWVRTHDRFPFRHPYVKGGVKWEDEYPNWHQIEARCLRFNQDMMKHSKIIFFIGQENHDSWRSFITLASGDRVHQVQLGSAAFEGLNLPSHIFGAKPAFFTVRDSSGTVKQLVFSSYHSQFCVNGGDMVRGAYMDLIWNAALNFAELDVRQYDTFTRGMGLKPREPTRFRCFFVDPETDERCCATRQHLGSLRKHWDACHSKVDGVSWDESLVEELPKEIALALDPEGHKSGKSYTNAAREAAHKEAVLKRKEERQRANAVPVVKERLRIGRRPKDLDKKTTRFSCYYVDPETGVPCDARYGTLNSLEHMHFKVQHPHARWDKSAVTTVKEDKAGWSKSRAPLETITTQQERKMTKGNARGAKSRAKLAKTVTLQCNFCAYSNKNHRSNMKTHVEKHHPGVVYDSKTSFTRIEKRSEDSDSDKENEA